MSMRVLVDPANRGLETDFDIVAIPGLGANAVHTWSARRPLNPAERSSNSSSNKTLRRDDGCDPNRVYWLQEFLPEAFPNARIMTFDHNADWIWNAPTVTAAQTGVQMIRDIRSVRDDLKADSNRPLVFVAHSYGGIILKQAFVLSEAEDIRQATQSVIFLGTPHIGSQTAGVALILLQWLGLIAWMCGSKLLLLKCLEWHSEALRDLDIEFSKSCPSYISISCFYETKDSYLGFLNLGRIVNYTSATLAGHRKGIQEIKIDKDHTGLNKCIDREDQTLVQTKIAIRGSVYRMQEHRRKLYLEMFANGAQNLRQEQIKRAVRGTCRWIEELPEFQTWTASSRSSTFCLIGKPGCGKSTILSEMVHRLRYECGLRRLSEMFKEYVSDPKGSDQSKESIVVASFFFSVEVRHETNYVHMLQSILFQILLQCPTLLPAYQQAYEEGRRSGVASWSSDVLESCFSQIKRIGVRKQQICIYIDAVDECDMPAKVFEMVQNLSREEVHNNITFKTFLTSRPTDITIVGPVVEISNQNNADIDRLLDVGMASIKKVLIESSHDISWKMDFSNQLQKIGRILHDDANGVILWVALILRRIEKELSDGVLSPHDLGLMARTNPTDLDTLYSLIVRRLTSRHEYENQRKKTKNGLSWAAFTFELLSKRSFTIATALSQLDSEAEHDDGVSDNDGTAVMDQLRQYTFLSTDSGDFQKALSALYGGFLEFKYERGVEVVGLLHRTVRKFLQNQKACPFQIEKDDSDGIIVSACVQYLRIFSRKCTVRVQTPNSASGERTVMDEWVKMLDLETFLPYIFKNLPRHLERLGERKGYFVKVLHDIALNTIAEDAQSQSITVLIEIWGQRSGFIPVKQAAGGSGRFMLVTSLLHGAVKVGALTTTKILYTAGCLEAESFKAQALEHTLKHRQWLIWNFLTKEAFQGHEISAQVVNDTIHQLIGLEGGMANHSSTSSTSADAKSHVVPDNQNDHIAREDALIWLLQGGASTERFKAWGDLLHFAASQGYDRLIRLLALDSSMTEGLIQTKLGPHSGTALHIAAQSGHAKVVEELLKAGAQPGIRDTDDRSPFWYAVRNSREDIVHLLIAAGAQDEAAAPVNVFLPRSRNPSFVGRDDILTKLENLFDHEERQLAALVGIGGSGKTELALELSFRFHESYPEAFIGWMNASTEHGFEQSHRQIAQRMGLAQPTDNIDDVMQIFYAWVANQHERRSILIWDGWDDSEMRMTDKRMSTFFTYFVPAKSSHLLVTTRNLNIARSTPLKLIEAHPLLESELETFFSRFFDDTDTMNLQLLAEQLGGNPLAIVQAANYIRTMNVSVRDYLRILENTSIYSDANTEPFSPLARSLDTDLKDLESNHPRSSELLFLMCSLDATFIPADLFQQLRSVVTATVSDTDILGSMGLISQQPESQSGVGVHLSTRNHIRRRLEKQRKLDIFDKAALSVVSDIFPDQNFEDWKTCAALYPQAKIVLRENIMRNPQVTRNSRRLRRKLGDYLRAIGSYQEANKILQLALVESYQVFGEWSLNIPEIMEIMASLGTVNDALGKYGEAELLHTQALKGFRTLLGDHDLHTISCMTGFASHHLKQGRSTQAKSLLLQAKSASDKVLGQNESLNLTIVLNLSRMYLQQNEVDEAEVTASDVVKKLENRLGKRHPDTLTSMAHLASIYQRQARLDGFTQLATLVMETRKEVLGEDHPDTLDSVANVAVALRERSNDDEAIEMMAACVDRLRQTLGPLHPSTISAVKTLVEWQFNNEGLD